MTHQELVQDATDAINAVHGDTSVTPAQTKESLEELGELIRESIAALETDNPDLEGE